MIDVVIFFRTWMVLIFGLMLCNPSWACDSYEECMIEVREQLISSCKGWYDVGISDEECLTRGAPTEFMRNLVNNLRVKAIAYKWEEDALTLDTTTYGERDI